MAGRSGEFELIRRFFAPLARDHPGSFALEDDAAVLAAEPGQEIVVTADAMVAGVHFLDGDPPGEIARKLLRVNLSDLAAMAARPLGYVLTAAWPAALDDDWIAAFAAGLAADQAEFEVALMGGDTVATPGPLTLSLTAFGEVPAGAALCRSGARPGDFLFVSGCIGDAGAGLALAQDRATADPATTAALLARYRLPRPRLALGQALRGVASACIDVSDGLLADLGHIVTASGVGAEVLLDSVPLSPGCRRLSTPEAAVAAGDDYELLFTAPPAAVERIPLLASRSGVAISRIGRIDAAGGIRVLRADGTPVKIAATGFRHF